MKPNSGSQKLAVVLFLVTLIGAGCDRRASDPKAPTTTVNAPATSTMPAMPASPASR